MHLARQTDAPLLPTIWPFLTQDTEHVARLNPIASFSLTPFSQEISQDECDC